MEKFKVHVHYRYAAYIEVYAENIKDAYDKGLAIADKMPSNLLEYVGPGAGDVVIDSKGECYEM